jgi:hypothetical protein
LRAYKPGYYSTARGAKKRDYIINEQTGRFKQGWRKRPVKRAGNEFTVSIFNVAMPVAAFLILGTYKMRERPIMKKVIEESRPLVNKIMSRHRMRLMRLWRSAGGGRPEKHGG